MNDRSPLGSPVELASRLSHASLQGSTQTAMAAHADTTPVIMDFANYSATETLRDGRTVEIRAQRSQDREGMLAAIARSSSGSLYRRFFAVRREFSEKETERGYAGRSRRRP